MVFPILDLVAVCYFFVAWFAYMWFAEINKSKSLFSYTRFFRQQWMLTMAVRENRVADASIIGSLLNSGAFFASTTLLILLGLFTGLASGDAIHTILAKLPFVSHQHNDLWIWKLFLLIGIISYAFFKFTWSLRQLNYCAIFIGAAPIASKDAKLSKDAERHAKVTAELNAMAGRHFNNGLRSYYFAMAALGWIVHPWCMIILTTWVVAVLYRREFASRLLKILKEEAKKRV